MTEADRDNLRDVLSTAIVDAGMTTRQVAVAMEHNSVYNWLSGELDVIPTVRLLVHFGRVVGVPASELLRRAGL